MSDQILNWKQLKEFANGLSEEDLEQPVLLCVDDSESLKAATEIEVSHEDLYVDDGEVVGHIEQVADYAKDMDITLDECLATIHKIPAGRIQINSDF